MSSRRANTIAAGVGVILFTLCALAARNGNVSAAEKRAFHALNDLPGWLYRPMFVFQQTGNLIIAIIAVIVLAALLKNWRVAVAGLVALAAKLTLERVVKAVIERQRPGTSTGGHVILRGSVSAHGLSFVSGHAVITVALAMVFAPLLPGRWRVLPWVIVVLNGIARVYVGAHNPLDVLGGVGLGLFIGGVVNLAIAPRSATRRARMTATTAPLVPPPLAAP